MTAEHDWITDRRPTEADGDEDGKVFMRTGPNAPGGWCHHWNAPGGWCHHWSYVGEGAPWRHTSTWKPAAPEPSAPEPPATTPRKFIALTRTVWMDGGGSQAHTLDAIADDGTAWWMVAGETTWLQTPPLPAREVQAND